MIPRRILLWIFVTTAGAVNLNLTEIATLLPACSFPCIINNLSPTVMSDLTLICKNNTLQATLTSCIQTRCNYTDQGKVAIANSNICSGLPIESRGLSITIIGLVMGPLAVLTVALRCYSRYAVARQFGWDDTVIVISTCFLVVLIALDVQNSASNGFGRHIWDIDPRRAKELLMNLYICEVFYVVVVTLIKASILCFYLRVFSNYWFQMATRATLMITLLSGVAFVFAAIFQCTPVSGAWDLTIPHKCIKVNNLAFIIAGFTIGLDIVIIALPIPECLALRMNTRKKLNVLFMFSIGAIACVTSMVRMKYIVNFATTSDPTWDNVPAINWSFFEICIATICACLPATRALLSRYLPSLFSISHSSVPSTPGPSQRPKADTYHKADIQLSRPQTEKSEIEKSEPGPLHDKKVITCPDDAFLHDLDPESKFTKIWVNPRFDRKGNIVNVKNMSVHHESHYGSIHESLHERVYDSSDTSLFILEGPRLSDDEDMKRVMGMESDRRTMSMYSNGRAISLHSIGGRSVQSRGRPLRRAGDEEMGIGEGREGVKDTIYSGGRIKEAEAGAARKGSLEWKRLKSLEMEASRNSGKWIQSTGFF
ncbi:hypothetical protein BGZ60DRAFT_68516 [Tricladium varicosporioides]|nr:hypothetical protein BGZ60DRAFT_68516 [Hymenoscyphus varicosporioides]